MKSKWIAFALVIGLSFAVLGWTGVRIYQEAPPIPSAVVTPDGRVLIVKDDIQTGQNVWQSMGGMELGSIWGHGSYVAPDWTADWLHRECTWLLDHWAAQSGGKTYDQLDAETQAALRERLKKEIRSNTYDTQTGNIVVSAARAEAMQAVGSHYAALFGNDPALKKLR